MCVAAPAFRSAPKSSADDQGQCNGACAFTLADPIAAAPIMALGATIQVRVWARDPASQGGFLLSNRIELAACP